ncbi:GTP cyclohydrolase [Mycobacterium paraense]|uniref:GTP cyclohydrolase 1 n=1 Tax=Mycobacterium paraense TaxID=767916 RepID=A0ABX3VTE3_9MYCO|nr:GTP cyclohydrolase I [Mycobacterium paraense]ORW33772.1 GTP cyclohydrolase [Mycobacterium paraense]ORW42000.1 GTP cyclohydrolase [Mycobacterium paraense]
MDLADAEVAVKALLVAMDIDEHDHTADTPSRVARAWRDMLAGYREDPADHLDRTFSAPRDPGLVIVEGVRLISTCAHHLLPFTGHATVAYRPGPCQRIVGLSKLARVVHGYARRLQVQERIGSQVVDAITDRLRPLGAMCLITATHDCMALRGVSEPQAATTTEARHGDLLDHQVALIHARHQGARR